MLKTFAISKISLSTLSIPLRIFKYMTGKTIRNDMNTLRFALPNHIIASITNEATGVDFITEVIGAKSIFTA